MKAPFQRLMEQRLMERRPPAGPRIDGAAECRRDAGAPFVALAAPFAALFLALLAGCGESVPSASGVHEPLVVHGGQFFEGALPRGADGPKIVNVDTQALLIPPGQVGKKLQGDVTAGAYSVAVRFADLGSGYWVVPVGPLDPQKKDGELTWEIVADIARDVPAGDHPLVLSSTDEQDRSGPVYSLPQTIQSRIPDGRVVISLRWDTDADLDLHLVAPNGNELDPKHITTAGPIDGGADALPPGTGVLDRDSNPACTIDGYRQEDAVFAGAPLPGTYLVRVDMFAACQQPAANFVVQVYARGQLLRSQPGRLLDLDADGGGPGAGLFVMELVF